MSSTAAEIRQHRTEGLQGFSVRVFLASALSPHVQAASRWVAVSAVSRRAFALAGKDSGTPFLHWLAAGRPVAGDDESRAAQRLGVDKPFDAPGFLPWYRALNHGYPFRDYAAPDALDADAQLMATYASVSDSPPPVTSRPGSRFVLPAGRVRMGTQEPPSAELVAGWLQLAAGFRRLRVLPHSTVAHRTSPSGGARHPTDLAVTLGETWPTELRGSWWYDPQAHALSPAEAKPCSPDAAVFTVSSHVARAMWRYRDVRAFRPVLIDAGHVVEALLAVVEAAGWSAAWYPTAGFVEDGDKLDPVLGYVVASPHGARPAQPPPVPLPDLHAGSGGPLRTNPLLSLTVTAEEVFATNHLTPSSGCRVSPTMIDALAFATPSSRGDRPTGVSDICRATGATGHEVRDLAEHELLLDCVAGDELWRRARVWFEHDWYLSLLAHAEESSARPSPSWGPIAAPAVDLPTALDRRRTCRAHGGTVADSTAQRVLATAEQLSIPVDEDL